MIWLTIIQILFTLFMISFGSDKWPNHEISTLKLLQIVQRHGDRTPLSFAPKDPYKDSSYWKEGIGQLTKAGKYRMYRLGQFIREEYNSYLGENYSPREVYARSSIVSRCMESVSCFLSGVYPPKSPEWQWTNSSDQLLGQLWQPIPIETFMPKDEDLVLRQNKFCPIVQRAMKMNLRSIAVKNFLKENKPFMDNLTEIMGFEVNGLKKVRRLFETLRIETERGLYWNNIWTKEDQESVLGKLSQFRRISYQMDRKQPIILRLRAGGLVKELTKNFNSVINNKNNKKLFVYSTHDSVMATFMNALNVYDNDLIGFGSTLLFELHQNNLDNNSNDNYFVKLYYINETINPDPYALSFGDCNNQYECDFETFIQSTKKLIYYNFDEECNDFDDD